MTLAPSLWGAQRTANVITTRYQGLPSVAGLANGQFVIGFLSVETVGATDFGAYLRLQAFDGFGARTGPNPDLDHSNPYFSGDNIGAPDIAAGSGGSLNVSWHHTSGINNAAVANRILSQSFGSDLSALSTLTTVAFKSVLSVYADAQVAIGPTDRVFVSYDNISVNGGDVELRQYAGIGLADTGPATTVNTTLPARQNASDVAVSGNVAMVVFQSEFLATDHDVYVQRYDAGTGVASGGQLSIDVTSTDVTNPVITGVGGGVFAIATERATDIYVTRVGTNNTLTNVLANTSTAGTQVKPAITASPDGSVFVAWEDPNGASGRDIRGQLFDSSLNKVGTELLLTGAGDQSDVTLSTLSDGRIVAAFTDSNADGNDSGVGYVLVETRGAVINGTAGNDFLIGTDGGTYVNNLMSGLGGNDIIYGLSGWDHLFGDDGDDILFGGDGGDYLSGGNGIDQLYGGEGGDYLVDDSGASSILDGGAGVDHIYGGAGNDYVIGGDGDDTLVGLGGQDSLFGGNGNDYIVAGDGVGSVVDGGAGANTLWGAGGNDYLVGGELSDLVVGAGGSDYLFGNAGDDTLYGGQGTDYIYTNAGNDFIWTDDVGAPQSTDYIYAGGGTGVDTIADFTVGGANADVVVISPASGITNFTQLQAATTQAGIYSVISLSGGDAVYLYNVQPSQLTASNFMFF